MPRANRRGAQQYCWSEGLSNREHQMLSVARRGLSDKEIGLAPLPLAAGEMIQLW